MTSTARVAAAVSGGIAVMGWAVWHGPFNGANLLVIVALLGLAFVAWAREQGTSGPSNCPHCGSPLDPWLDPRQRRGDGV